MAWLIVHTHFKTPHQRQFQAIVANKSGIVIRHRARSDTIMKNSVFGKRGEEGGWLLAAVFAVESNGLNCYARLTNTSKLSVSSHS